MITLSIIIVSWNVKDQLRACLRSINRAALGLALEIILVDNNSSDQTVAAIQAEFPTVRVIANHHNAGFAAANNQGLKIARGEYFLLLNPDTELTANSLTDCLQIMVQWPKIGLLGCQLLNADGTSQSSVRRFPWWLPLIQLLLKVSKWRSTQALASYLAADFDYHRFAQVDQVMGAFMLARRSAVDVVGLLDERFFIWFEEVDWCRRFWLAGWPVCYSPTPAITHYGGQSFSQRAVSQKQRIFFTSAWRYGRKHGWRQSLSHLKYDYPR